MKSCSFSDDYNDDTDSNEMNEDEKEDGSEDDSDLASRVQKGNINFWIPTKILNSLNFIKQTNM